MRPYLREIHALPSRQSRRHAGGLGLGDCPTLSQPSNECSARNINLSGQGRAGQIDNRWGGSDRASCAGKCVQCSARNTRSSLRIAAGDFGRRNRMLRSSCKPGAQALTRLVPPGGAPSWVLSGLGVVCRARMFRAEHCGAFLHMNSRDAQRLVIAFEMQIALCCQKLWLHEKSNGTRYRCCQSEGRRGENHDCH